MKATHDTDRDSIKDFQQIVNIGPSIADDFRLLGLKNPQRLTGNDPWKLYRKLTKLTGEAPDPCVLDVFMSAIDYMNGNPPQQWWKYTATRKEVYGEAVRKLRGR